ncbi:hypothetical protein GCM10020255_010510 [Rhodococcus baikonurensis]
MAKHRDDEVFAGTLNGTGTLRIRIDHAASETVVARIVAMVEEASATKAKSQLFIEKVEQYYSVGVVAATLAVFFIPFALGGALQPSLLRAMTFMIVASRAQSCWPRCRRYWRRWPTPAATACWSNPPS